MGTVKELGIGKLGRRVTRMLRSDAAYTSTPAQCENTDDWFSRGVVGFPTLVLRGLYLEEQFRMSLGSDGDGAFILG